MRSFGLIVLAVTMAGSVLAQSITEVGVAAAGGTVGGAAGKGLSDQLTNVFGKVDDHTKAAAKQDPAKKAAPKQAPANPEQANTEAKATKPDAASVSTTNAAPASSSSKPTVKSKPVRASVEPASREKAQHISGGVPEPPPAPSHAAAIPPPAPQTQAPSVPAPVVIPPPPPPPVVTAKDLETLAPGTSRADLLKLGTPAARITMFDDGHLLEIFSYAANNSTLGVVRLTDGEVSRVEIR